MVSYKSRRQAVAHNLSPRALSLAIFPFHVTLPSVTIQEGVNGVNRLATKGEKYYRLPTKREKNYWLPTEKKLTDYRHGPPLSIFVFRKKRSEEHFVFFLAYEVTTLKVIVEFPVIFLLFGRKSAASFCRTISRTRAHETSRCNISTTSFVQPWVKS